MTDVVLECRQLSKEYAIGPQRLKVLDGVNLTLHRGERVAIVGSSGSGKTTLLNMLGGLDTPSEGEVWLAGQQMSALKESERGKLRNTGLGFVYQFHHLLAEFSALENVSMPLLIGERPISDVRARAEEMLDRVGLAARTGHKPAELSGGERQRVAIARALINQPACVLLDEPTGNLDQHTARSIQHLMLELSQSLKTAFLVVTHDLALAGQMDRALTLNEGRLQEKQIG
ncbi:lipoprotein-releasing ABC transporter ATP-binding protein LolD [Halopseudomonas nanhaiensis]|uniref:lipoprotein-releasing ABC transporter ATP-binding protein LolD n=1 Tax=Halopseudomonas nanhaiensis TaxID=2830842 RepID=UPI001CC06C12|nr:lipoprotein-releasing ABC transporter ATP-binding protein LolD [Halopseudomonas nanhaiensis]UAW96972.1 lipoprotein-releasing ABC transporter ATP-binding protein LolD [Halopseudomonas nanhaiensis]